MSIARLVADGSGEDSFIITREQVSKIIDAAYEQGRENSLKPGWFECKHDELWLSVRFGQVARAERLHIVTARHLRKARKTIRKLRKSVERLQRLCDEKNALIYAYRGSTGNVCPSTPVPEHYLGDGYVTCDRAIEAASAQRCIVNRPPLNYWYWATAFKYVWRMWSKGDPEADAGKAIECLMHVLELLDGESDER